MSKVEFLPFTASLEAYKQQAETLFAALRSGEEEAQWRFKWLHHSFRGKTVSEVRSASVGLGDAQQVVAHEYSFENWAELVSFTDAVKHDGPVRRFETAVEAVI